MRISFDRGTLVLQAEDTTEDPRKIRGATYDTERAAWCVPAEAYRPVIGQLSAGHVRISDTTPPLALDGEWKLPPLRWYQNAALTAWSAAGARGVVALPTGAGKTLVAIAAISELAVATLVLVPTRVLLDQWVDALATCWSGPIGRLGDGDHRIEPITVATYASAVTWLPRIGDRFGLVIVDEAHHVGAWCPREVLEMSIAPARLGLTATPPSPADAPRDGMMSAHDALARHVGPVVYALRVDQLAGSALASYELVTVPIRLTPDEQRTYRDHRQRFAAVYAPYMRASPGASWREFVRAARESRSGRDALASWRAYRHILAYAQGKRDTLRAILARHAGQRILVFTADNASAYAIARELLVMPVTHEIGRAEREAVLARFRSGALSVLVSSQVLDEGLDVPDAEVAVIVGGSASARRQVQRIGRVLRPRDGKHALVYELAIEETAEVGYVRRRRAELDAPLPRLRSERSPRTTRGFQ